MPFPNLARLLRLTSVGFAVFALLSPGTGRAAQVPEVFADGFEAFFIAPIFPQVGGVFQLPSNATTDQLDWLMGELAADETTTAAEVDEHFDAVWLSQISVEETRTFLQNLRTGYPDAVISDVVTVTPVRVVVVIRSPGNGHLGYVQVGARYSGARKLVQFGVNPYGGSVQYPADQVLTLTQAADRFETLSTEPGLLVARIDAFDQCVPIEARAASTTRATGSIFKLWVLAGLAEAIAQGATAPDDPVALVASEIAPSGTINSEPLGTIFPVFDLATLMMGISDNSATDLLHEHVGRPLLDQAIAESGVDDPTVLQPLLGISEQFHLFRSFPLPEAESYVDGSEAFQADFLDDEIVPLGPVGNGPHAYFNVSLLTDGSWHASPDDICATFASLRHRRGEALRTVEFALGASAAQPDVRGQWDRVWYKGGSLASSSLHVLTHAWMLERNGEAPVVVVAMSNSDAGGIDQFDVQSVTGRILELVAELP